jgi:ATP-dependent protease ClpP protease subunit
MRKWFRIDNVATDPTTIDIHIVDIIGGWIDEYLWEGGGPGVVTAKSFIDALSKLADTVKTIRLHVNSPGGDVFAAVNITNALRDQRLSKGRTVDVLIDGLAASAASIIIMAGDTIRMADNALVMIHNPWSIGAGDAAAMRKIADELDAVRQTIVATYQWQSALTEDELIALMDAETWMSADEAVDNGFATEKVVGLKAAASLDPRALTTLKIPDQYRARVEALVAKPVPAADPTPPAAPAADVLRLCREGECLDVAESLLADGATLDQVTARVADARAERQVQADRARDVTALCQAAHVPELADGYIQGGMSVDAVRAQLTVLTAKLDQVEIDGGLAPDAGTRKKARIDVSAVYAERNKARS